MYYKIKPHDVAVYIMCSDWTTFLKWWLSFGLNQLHDSFFVCTGERAPINNVTSMSENETWKSVAFS